MITATVLALAAAILHAGWNLIVKTSVDRELAAWGQFVAGGVIFLPLAIWSGGMPAATVPFIAASTFIHLFYVEALVRAYHHGDFSFAYPIARGGGALGAAVGGWLFLHDGLPAAAWLALAVVGVGLGALVRPGVTRASVVWALGTALTISIYTVVDSAGARHAGKSTVDRFSYGVVLTIATAIALTAVGLSRGRGHEFVVMVRNDWRRVALSGLCLTSAYSLVLVAVSIRGVQVGYVSTLRESSVVLGTLAGWLFLKESLGKARLVASLVVLSGMIGLVIARVNPHMVSSVSWVSGGYFERRVGLEVIAWPDFDALGVDAMVTTRDGGVSAGAYAALNLGLHVGDDPDLVIENRAIAARAFGAGLDDLAFCNQVHGRNVVVVDSTHRGRGARSMADVVADADAMVTTSPNVTLVILVADCVPLLLFDPAAQVLGVVHAGWPGTAAGVVPAALDMMATFGSEPENVVVGIGPAVSAETYQVDARVVDASHHLPGIDECLISDGPGHWLLDLPLANRRSLEAAGVRPDQIHGTSITTSDRQLFSNRSEAPCGRFALFARLLPAR